MKHNYVMQINYIKDGIVCSICTKEQILFGHKYIIVKAIGDNEEVHIQTQYIDSIEIINETE